MPKFDDGHWAPAQPVGSQAFFHSAPLAPKITSALQLVTLNSVRLTPIFSNASGQLWTFQLEKEVQGGVRLHFDAGISGVTATVRLGEELTSPNSSRPKYRMRTGNLYQDIFTLRDRANDLETHEYQEFRFGEVLLEPPDAALQEGCGLRSRGRGLRCIWVNDETIRQIHLRDSYTRIAQWPRQ